MCMKFKQFTLFLAFFASVGTMFAEKVQIGNLYYNLKEDKTAEVTYDKVFNENNYKSLTTADIPASVTYSGTTYSVTSIGWYAFYECTGLTSVTIPNSVTSIGVYAFVSCSGLTSFSVAGDNSNYSSKEGVLFNKQQTTLIQYPARKQGEYIIPNSVTSIVDYAFYGCSGLTSLTIPNSITSIVDNAFTGCSSLTSITIPNSITSIGNEAFAGCSSLTSVTIPNSVTSIGTAAFYGCSGLTSVTIPNSITSIVDYAFEGCSSLTSVTIPNNVTNIGKGAFSGCSSLSSVTIPNSVTSIGESVFSNCSSLTAVEIPNSITSIGYSAFAGCSSLTAVEIPNSVTSIGWYAFYECTGLTSVTIPNSVTSIGHYAFTGCSSLTSITTPNSITSIGNGAFTGCSSLTSIYVPCGEMERFKQLLKNDSRVKYEPVPYTITITAENGSVIYPQTKCDDMLLTATPDYGYHFKQWSDGNTDNPRTIELRQDTTFEAIFAVDKYGTCGDNLQLTWRYDTGNQTLTISGEGDLTTNMRYGVEAVKEMKELVIEDGVGVIGNEAFANIKTLNTITLGKDVRKLQERVFYNCYNLTAIYNYRKTPASATSNTFEEVDKYACTIYVLAGSEEMFRSATGWKDFYSILAIGATETTVSDNKVSVEPSDNSATVTWPVSNEAASYTIDITKDGVVFCRLTFNANGQLTGIAFAPGRDGQSMAPAAVMTANGLQFTLTGLSSNTEYGYTITAKDAEDAEVASYSGSFTTTSEGVVTGLDNTPFLSGEVRGEASKLLRNGEVLILRDGKTYSIQGVEVK